MQLTKEGHDCSYEKGCCPLFTGLPSTVIALFNCAKDNERLAMESLSILHSCLQVDDHSCHDVSDERTSSRKVHHSWWTFLHISFEHSSKNGSKQELCLAHS